MSRAEEFNFENSLDEYKDRISNFKESAERLINAPDAASAVKQAADIVGTPVGIEMLRAGIKARYAKTAEAVKGKVDEAVGKAKQAVEDTVSKAKQAAQDVADRAQSAVEDAGESVRNTLDPTLSDLADQVSTATSQAAAQASQAAANLGSVAGESGTTFEDAFNVGSGAFGADATPEQLESMYAILNAKLPLNLSKLTDEQFEMATVGRANAIRAGIARPTQGELDDMDEATRANFTDEGVLIQQPSEAGVAAAARAQIGDALQPMRDELAARAATQSQQADQALPEAVQTQAELNTGAAAQGATPPSSVVADAADGERVEGEIVSNASRIAKVTGQTGSEAIDEAEGGVSTATKLASTTEETLVDTGETLATTTGGETDGVGFIIGGVIALAGVLASVFTGHQDKPVKPPNLSIPVEQLGIGN